MTRGNATNWIGLLAFITVVAAVSLSASQFRPGDWYAGLAKPPWTPPNWVFAPVWTLLYVMIAVAGWRAWLKAGVASLPLALWALQMIFNGAWSWLFFGRHEIGLALADLNAMWIALLGFIAATWRIDRPAALLFLPYLAWVGYAGALNAAIWRLNP